MAAYSKQDNHRITIENGIDQTRRACWATAQSAWCMARRKCEGKQRPTSGHTLSLQPEDTNCQQWITLRDGQIWQNTGPSDQCESQHWPIHYVKHRVAGSAVAIRRAYTDLVHGGRKRLHCQESGHCGDTAYSMQTLLPCHDDVALIAGPGSDKAGKWVQRDSIQCVE